MNGKSTISQSLKALALVLTFAVPSFAAEPFEALGKRVQHETTSVLSNWADSGSGDVRAKAKEDKTQDRVEVDTVNGGDGRSGHKQISLGDMVVDTMPPETFDEGKKIQSFDDEDGKVMALIYGDKGIKMYRVNGFPTDIPYGAKIERVEADGDKVQVIWRSADGQMMALEVESLQNRRSKPYYTGDPLHSRPYGGGSGNPAPNNDDIGNAGNDSAANDQANNTPPPVVIPEPGNSYGIDPVLTDAEVEIIASDTIARIKASYHAPAGLVSNEWGVLVGNGITHSGGVDGYDTPIRFWMMTDSRVRQAVAAEAQKVRESHKG